MTAPTARTYGFFYMAGDPTFLLGGILFIMGAVISFITPLGGISQIAGWAIFFSVINPILGTHIGHPGVLYTNYLGLGFWLGLIGGVLCVLSIIAPIGLGQPLKNPHLKNRLLTIHLAR